MSAALRREKGADVTARRLSAWLTGLVLAAVLVPAAPAAKPEFQRIDIDESFVDAFLSEACGVTVMTHAEGHIIFRAFPGDGTGPVELTTISVRLTATAGDNSYRFRDVGADLLRIEPDGTAVLSIIGQLPFDFTGVLKIDLETGEAILEPQHSLADRLDDACAALTA
jgi:hypothetical protein